MSSRFARGATEPVTSKQTSGSDMRPVASSLIWPAVWFLHRELH
jgi:hypothetical protein